MKKTLYSIILILLFAVFAKAADFQPFVYPMVGKWEPSGQSIMGEEYSLQDVQNLRKEGSAWVGVKGHTKINTTLLSTYPYLLNGFHFRKQQPAESHVLVLTGDTAVPANSQVYENTTAIPTAGDFSATLWHDDETGGMGTGRFSNAPNGNMVYSNGVVQHIWGGTESKITAFYTASAAEASASTILETPGEYTEVVTNSNTSDVVTLTRYFFIGTTRPVEGFKFYVGTANAASSTIAVLYWNGAEWTAVSSPVDGTTVGGKTLAQTGTITFTSTATTAKPRYIQGVSLYWYQVTMSATTSTTLSQVTALIPKQTVKNVWNGAFAKPVKGLEKAGSQYWDSSDNIIDGVATTVLDISDDSFDGLYFAFTQPQQALKIQIDPDNRNNNAVTLTVKYWNGSAWAAVPAMTDGTATSGATLSATGIVSWNPIASGLEQKTTLQDEVPLYYYELTSSGAVDEIHFQEIRGAESPVDVKVFKFSEQFQNRLFLFSEVYGKKNKLQYSAYNSPEVYNGTDSGFLYVGDDSQIIAAKPVFNIFKAGAYDQLIIGKANEIWRLSGDGPATWTLARISPNVGVVAPLSMVSSEVAEGMEEGVKRQVVIFQGAEGFYVTDGASVIPISEDIRCYFDRTDARYIPDSMKTRSFAWYDPSLNVYKVLIASGSTATYLNTELEFNLAKREWTKVYRADGAGANPLQSGFQVMDTNGVPYTYGGNTKGNLYRLENGYTFDSTAVAQYLWTKDFIPDKGAPVLRKTTIKDFRAMAKKQAGTMTVTHYGDGTATVNGTGNQRTIDAIDLSLLPYTSQSCALGPFLYHSFKFANSASTNTGMELSGFGFWYEPFTAWR